jgi:hypothetical protein
LHSPYWKTPGPFSKKTGVRNLSSQGRSSNPIEPINKRDEINRRSEIEQVEQIEPIKQISPQPKSEVAVKVEKMVTKEVDKLVPKEVNKDAFREFVKAVPRIEHPVLPSSSQTIFESGTSVKVEKVVPKEITEVISQESLKIVPKEVPEVEEVKPNIEEPGSTPPSHFVQSENPVSSSSYVASTPLITREEEVRQFFINYIDRYTRKDIDGFLSFFSFKAIQNQKGFDEIKKVYTIFFKESEELRYQLGDLKIENHQNNVEVTANYKVDQVLKKRGEKRVWKGQIRWLLVRENDVLKILFLDYQHQRST